MKRQYLLKSTLCLLMALVCNAVWAQTSADGPIVTFTNVQQDGTEFTLYINESDQLAISTSPAADLGEAAQFRATQQGNGKYTFYNESKGLYMIWKGGSGGYNGNSGVLAEYNATYCDWQVTQANGTAKGTFYFSGKRSNGNTDGTLVIMKATGVFDAYGNSAGWSDRFSNLYRIESATPIKYTLTYSQSGGQITGTGTSLEPMNEFMTLSNKKLEGMNFTADATLLFSFPVSAASDEQGVFISPFNTNAIKYYVDADNNVKATKNAANSKNFVWAIYPSSFGANGLTFAIKNIGTGKYIYTESATRQHGEGVVTMSDAPTLFEWATNNMFKTPNKWGGKDLYLSTSSSTATDQFAGTWDNSGHNGIKNSIYTAIGENTYTLTDAAGNVYEGTYDGYVGISSEPTFTGVDYTLTNKAWKDNAFTATIEFTGLPFPVSKPGEEDWTFIRSFTMTDGKCYFHVDDNYTKVITRSTIAANGMTYLPTADKIAKWQWAIYPAIEDGKIVFTIKNKAANKFVGGTTSTSTVNPAPLADEGGKFCWGACIGNGKGFYLADNTNMYFAANSSKAGDQNAILWPKSGSSHQGGNLEFLETSYTVTTDAAGYATLYTPIAVTIPSGVAAYTGRLNATNTLLSLDEVSTAIPANTAVLLIGAASTTYTFAGSGDVVAAIEGNVFQGSDTSVDVASIEGSAYTYEHRDGDVAFAKVTEGAIPGYTAYIAVQSEAEVIITDTYKAAAKAAVAEYTAKLKNQPGYYYCTIDETNVYSAEEVNALIDATETKEAAAEIVEAVKVQTLILPEAGKYYRIAYDYGNSGGVKYLQSTYHSGSQLALTANKDEASLFYVEQVGENLRLKSYTTGKYLREDGTTRGLHDTGGNVTFSAGSSIGKIKIRATSYLHANGSNDNCYLDHCSGDGHDTHNFIVEEVSIYTLTVDALVAVGATATWNGTTKPLPASWAMFDGISITDPTLSVETPGAYIFNGLYEGTTALGNSVEIATLDANRTLTTAFSLDIFSASTAEADLVPVRIYSNRDKKYTLRINAADSYTAHGVNSGTTAYAENEIWYLVGSESSFKLYSHAASTSLAVTFANNNGGTAATLTTTGTNLCLTLQTDGSYAISPVGATGQSFNMHGGNGNDIKLFSTSDNGSKWLFNKVNKNPLAINYTTSFDGGYDNNTRIAEVTFNINGTTSNVRWNKGEVSASQSYYLPVGATFSIVPTVYHGWEVTFNGEPTLTEQTLPDDGLVVAASIEVDETNKFQYLFYSNDPVMNKPYRIPAITVTRKGTVLAVTDHRPGGSDVGFAPVDIKIRRSDDNGKTWSDEEFIANGTGQHVTVGDVTHTNVFDYAFGDAAIVADRESDEVLIMCVGGKQNFPGGDATHHNYTARLRSHDGGVTWDEPENVTANFMDVTPLYNNENPKGYQPILPEAYTLFYGSGRILQSRVFKAEGSDYYRIYAALLVREVIPGASGASHNNYVVYSDNFGETWNLLGSRCVLGGDEAKVEELPDGTIVISSRKYHGRYFNIFTFTDIAKAQGAWSTTVASNDQTGGISFGNNSCNGEIYKVKAIHNATKRICDVMLQSVPTGNGRSNVAVYFKEMDYTAPYTPTTFAENWTKGMEVSSRGSAYSTMALQADGRFGFFYEEEPNGYCMVYVPLTLDEMTHGAYSLYTVNSTITDVEIGTFYATEAMQIPEGVKAYVADSDPEEDVITMKRLEGIIPARTGAVLRGEQGDYKFIPSIGCGTPVAGNLLVGHEAAKSGDTEENRKSVVIAEAVNATIYVLAQGDDNNAMFYRKEADFTVKNNKAYLQVPNQALAKGLRVRFAGEDTTGIENSELSISNSQFSIFYDLQGRRVLNPGKGVYIVNGRKVVIK